MTDNTSSAVLVTGAAGFIGSHVCDLLLKRGHRVIGVDNFDPGYARQTKEENLQSAKANPNFSLVEGDIRDARLADRIFREHKISVVLHFAARPGVRASIEAPELCMDTNVRGTIVQLEAARKAGVKRFVFASSSSVYGNRDEVPFRELDSTDQPLSPYGASKKAGEAICYTYHHLYGMAVACLRLFTVYGPRQRPDLAIRKFAELALAGKPLPVFGDGTSRRDYTHIQDILTGIQGAMGWCSKSGPPRYGTFNLGSNNPVTLEELLRDLSEALQMPLKREQLPFQSGDVFQTYADTTLAERELSFRHTIPFKQGLADFCRWLKDHR